MTRCERVLAALRHTEPDCVPMDLGGSLASTMVSGAYPALRAALGLEQHAATDSPHYASLADIEPDVRAALDVDLVHAPRVFGNSPRVHALSPERFVDEWGVQWQRPRGGHFYVERAPFEAAGTVAAVAAHPWPESDDLADTRGAAAAIAALRAESDCAITLELRGRVLSLGQFLRGFSEWMMDLADNLAFVEALLEQTTNSQIAANERILADLGDRVDVVYTSDDLGGQPGPLIAPATFRRLLRPHFARIWRHIRERTDAVLMHHCCGAVAPFLPDFVDLGLQALNPVQVSAAAMEPARLKREFGRNLAFWGAVDTRDVLPRGTTADVRAEVRRRIRELAPGGGYVLAAVHNLQPEVPPENVLAMFDECRRCGRYPIS